MKGISRIAVIAAAMGMPCQNFAESFGGEVAEQQKIYSPYVGLARGAPGWLARFHGNVATGGV